MKIVIGENEYADIKALSFAPETDVVGSELPINQFSAAIITADAIDVGDFALLYDDLDNLWAKYWITEADRVNERQVNILAESILLLLDRRELEPAMYDGETVEDVIEDIFSAVEAQYPGSYELDPSLANLTLTGYVAHHSAKYRLQVVCFVIGAYVKSFFGDKIEILPIDDTITDIPVDKTFWRPSVSYDDYVTAIKASAYTYTEGIPGNVDKWVEVDGVYYIETKQEISLINPDVPITAPINEVLFDEITLINEDNVDDILSRVSDIYFKRGKVEAEVINNAEFEPGANVTLPVNMNTLVSGFVKSCSFTFGVQAKAKIEVIPVETVESALLTINYFCGYKPLGSEEHLLPVGRAYSIELKFIEKTDKIEDDSWLSWREGMSRTVYRPTNSPITGVLPSGGKIEKAVYEIALFFLSRWDVGRRLEVLSVDEVTMDEDIDEDAERIVEIT